jgi:hypothetical protein
MFELSVFLGEGGSRQGANIEDVLARVMKGIYTIPRHISRDSRNLVTQMLEKVHSSPSIK